MHGRRQRIAEALAELAVFAHPIADGGKPDAVEQRLRRLGFDAAATAIGSGRSGGRREFQLGNRDRHLPPPALMLIWPRSRKFGSLASCAISSPPISMTPVASDVGNGSSRRWKVSMRTDSTPSTACAAATMRLR